MLSVMILNTSCPSPSRMMYHISAFSSTSASYALIRPTDDPIPADLWRWRDGRYLEKESKINQLSKQQVFVRTLCSRARRFRVHLSICYPSLGGKSGAASQWLFFNRIFTPMRPLEKVLFKLSLWENCF